jgi:hypothetical protein
MQIQTRARIEAMQDEILGYQHSATLLSHIINVRATSGYGVLKERDDQQKASENHQKIKDQDRRLREIM